MFRRIWCFQRIWLFIHTVILIFWFFISMLIFFQIKSIFSSYVLNVPLKSTFLIFNFLFSIELELILSDYAASLLAGFVHSEAKKFFLISMTFYLRFLKIVYLFLNDIQQVIPSLPEPFWVSVWLFLLHTWALQL
jgi:hypothetical protein